MRRETQNVLLILLGGALLKISLTDQYMRYVKPSFQWWLIIAGAVTVALAVIGIVRDLLVTYGRAAAATDGHGHDHNSRSPWLLMLPVFALFLVAPAALGADKVDRASDVASVPRQSTADFESLPDDAAPLLRMGETVTRAIWDDSGSLDGRQIRLHGFVVHGRDGSTQLARLVIGCCAADATPIRVKLDGGQADGYAEDTWLEVRGEIQAGTATEENHYVPTFVVSEVTEIPAPPDPYEF